MDCKEIKLINPKGNQPWILIRTDAEAPILQSDTESLPFGKKPDAGKDWGQEKEMEKKKKESLEGITKSTDMSLSKLQEMVKTRESWHAVVHAIVELDTT